MIKYTHTRLMYPEPDDTGGGGDVAPEAAEESKVDTNLFDFDNFDESGSDTGEQETDNGAEQEDSDYALTLDAELGLDKEEIAIFTAAAKKYGIDAQAASGMVAEFTKGINDNVRKVQEADAQAAQKALQEEWGGNFTNNVKRAGELIKRIGKAAGWSAELLESFKNPHSIRIFHDIARVMGSGKTVGLTQNTPVAPMSKSDIQKEILEVTGAFWNAKQNGDAAEAKRLSDRHHELQKMLTGKSSMRILIP